VSPTITIAVGRPIRPSHLPVPPPPRPTSGDGLERRKATPTPATNGKTIRKQGVEYHWYSPVRCAIRSPDKIDPELQEAILLRGGLRVHSGVDYAVVWLTGSLKHPIPGKLEWRDFCAVDGTLIEPVDRAWVAAVGGYCDRITRTLHEDYYRDPPPGRSVMEYAGGPALVEHSRSVLLIDADGWPVATASGEQRRLVVAGRHIDIDPRDPSLDWEHGWRIERSDIPVGAVAD